jgi:type II secretory pathway pseudopilin PulG
LDSAGTVLAVIVGISAGLAIGWLAARARAARASAEADARLRDTLKALSADALRENRSPATAQGTPAEVRAWHNARSDRSPAR